MRLSALLKKRLDSSVWRLVIVFLLFAFSFSLLAGSANAQTSVQTAVGSQSTALPPARNASAGVAGGPTTYQPNLNPDVPRDQHTYVQSVVIELLSSMICQMGGVDPIRPDHRCLGVDSQTGKIGFVEGGGGAIGVMGQFISYTFTPPLSSADYIRYLSGNFGITKKAYAATCSKPADTPQGVGFCGIQPLIGVWVAMRNIAYLLFVLIFVLIGLAIMLRVHIDPRTVMSIENQIPRIIVGILLVTFSFAIAGFLIDVMYVAIYLVGGVLATIPGHEIGVPFNEIATSPTPFDAINRLWPGYDIDGGQHFGGFPQLSAQGANTIHQLINNVFHGSPTPITENIWDIFTNTLGFLAGVIVGLLAFFIIFLALIYTAIRLWIILIVAYISVLLDVVFAPFWFLVGLFPGSSLGVGAWFKDMLANLAVFPTAIAMFVLGKVFSDIAGATTAGDAAVNPGLFIPPLAGGGAGPGTEVFAGLVALGFLFMTPHVLNITRGAIKAPAINYGPVFQPAGAAIGTLTGGAKEMGGTIMGSREYIPTGDTAKPWRKRSLGESFFGRKVR